MRTKSLSLLFFSFILIFSCAAKKKPENSSKKIPFNPTYNFVIFFDSSIEQKYRDKVIHDLKFFKEIKILPQKDLEFSLQRIGKSISDIIAEREVKELFNLKNFHFIAIFYKKDNRIYYKGYNLLTQIIDDFDVTEFLSLKDQNFLLLSQTGWLFIHTETKGQNFEVYVDYKFKGYLPILTSLNHGNFMLSIASYGNIAFEREISIPQETAINLGVLTDFEKEPASKEKEIESEDLGQAIFIAVITLGSIIAGIVIPIVVF